MSGVLHRVHLEDCTAQPWRNGGGLTRELMRWPLLSNVADSANTADAAQPAAADWQLRVSVADIERDGPFSAYPGVERWFAVLEGAGVKLGLPGGERRLVRGDAPVQFAGSDAPACHLVDGPTRDLNLMVRRGIGRMWKARAGEPADLGSSRWWGLYAATHARVQAPSGDTEVLEPGTLLWSDAPGTGRWSLLGEGLAFWMTWS